MLVKTFSCEKTTIQPSLCSKNIFCYFAGARNVLDTFLTCNLWNWLKELKFPFELRDIAIGSYTNDIVKFRNSWSWLREIKCNKHIKKYCSLWDFLAYTLTSLNNLEDQSCVTLTFVSSVIILIVHVNDILVMVMSPYDLKKQRRIIWVLGCSPCFIMNINKMKVMMTKSEKISYDTFLYSNNNFEDVPSYKCLGIDIHHMLN